MKRHIPTLCKDGILFLAFHIQTMNWRHRRRWLRYPWCLTIK
jgi:hypothetical protein